MNSLEIQDKKALLKQRANEMCDNCKLEVRMFTESEQSEYNEIIKQIKNLNSEMRDFEDRLNNTKEERKKIINI